MSQSYARCLSAIAASADADYKKFNDRIINSEYPSIGVRVPALRKLSRSVKSEERQDFLDGFFADPDKTYEAVLLAGLVAAHESDYERLLAYFERIVPLFGSWAHTDTVIPEIKVKDRERLLADFDRFTERKGQYEVRTYVVLLFDYLDEKHIDFVLKRIASIRTGEYYIDMALAWLTAECLVKFYDKTLPLIENRVFPPFVHNKAIQKARESFRVPRAAKEYLASLKLPRA